VKFAHSSKDLFSYNLAEPTRVRVAAESFERLDRQDCPRRPQQLNGSGDAYKHDDRGGDAEKRF
jgi:hypothetical protein